jgi:4-hydroxyphenylpyruvate dioxygenase
MAMRKTIATVSLSGTLEEKLVAAAQVGFAGIELFESDLISCPLAPAQVRRRADELGLAIELYQPLRDIEAVAEPTFRANLRRAEAKFQVMTELGVDTILLCSNVSPVALDDDALAAEQLGRVATLAGRYGIRVAYEALAWGRHVNTYPHAWKIVDAAGHPRLGVCLDSFHILSRRDDPAGIPDIPGEKIFFVQLADAPDMSLDVLQWSRHHRCFPGQGSFDLTGFLGRVIAAGYRGPLSLEVFNDAFRQADAERTATDALRSLIALEESLRSSLGDAGTSERLELAAPEAPVELTGYSFVEITVDPLAELASQHLLRGMGFRRVGRHRSKPVQMWQQGAARVLLNRTRPIRDDWPRGDAAVSAFAVEVDDPGRSARRAQALLAPAIARRYGPGEADLFATESPDGTSVFFCRTDVTDSGSWVADFDPIEEDQAEEVLSSIDHIGLSQPAYYFDEALLFYQSVLGLHRSQTEEVADPYGLMRSRAVASGGGEVRLVLNVPALGGGKRPETADFQHVAFSCADVFVAARRMRDLGLPVLPIPGNYYDDLAARTTLGAARIDAMRELSVCYDSDAHGGEFLHFYTAMLGRRLFFEIVQRVKDYDGYATANTSVRMAAQYRQTVLAGVID